jgi:hypothetical protein
MCTLFEDAISSDSWNEERSKFGYSNWMEEKLNDAPYNIVSVLEKCIKLQNVQLDQEQLAAFKTKVNSFSTTMKNWSKKSQKTSHWQ